ncbi:hypothetical protein [Reichenbachiella versicolor]|uniref:hypothetical protein n=1 Tax=Reichenbachiella versicolor TaxID=1821036 RepID=UPI000D6DE4D8|nr:hypothetical protein [Reichenbachiella versicolor]
MSSEFLKYLINEDIYIIEDEMYSSTSNQVSIPKPGSKVLEAKEPVSEVSSSYEPKNDILILYEGQVTDEMHIADMELLSKILGAVSCSLDQVDIRPNAIPIPLSVYEKVIAFTSNYNFTQKVKYSMYNEGGTKIIISDPLSKVAISTEMKKSLWGAIQQLF